MKIIPCSDYDDMSLRASALIVSDLSENPGRLLCAATGNSPRGLYGNLVAAYKERQETFRGLGVVKLDEWLGLPAGSKGSCEYYLQQQLVKPLALNDESYIGFRQDTAEAETECKRVEGEIALWGGIDWCVLGLGTNGHLGFNEPGDFLYPYSHKALLAEDSRAHQMIRDDKEKPAYGLTLGMKAIMQSRRIILLLTGSGKQQAVSALLERRISSRLPASFLWLHPETYCLRDMETTAF